MDDLELTAETESYVDAIFGPGMGKKHVQFLNRIENAPLREMVHRYHTLEADTRRLSLEENYLLGMCVSCATKSYATAAMFAKTLLTLGVAKEKLLEAVARLSMWIGGLPAVEAAFVIQRAIAEYERGGPEALAAWFPEEPKP